MPSAMEQIYDRLAEVFGGSNPNQFFTMMMPGTVLNLDDFTYDLSSFKPETVREAEARLVDQMFDLAKISASSNGRRVSSQFVESLRILVPNGNPVMPEVKNTLRRFLNQPIPKDSYVDGKPFSGTLISYYSELFQRYIELRMKWEQEVFDKKSELAAQNDNAREAFLEWYESVAEGRLAMIEAARARVTAVCSPADMDAILAALESGPSGGTEIEEAMATVRNARIADANGGYFYPVELTPSDWFLYIHSDADPDAMLPDPHFLAAALKTKREALQATLSQLQGMLASMPSDDAVAAASRRFNEAQSAHDEAQQGVMNIGSDAVALGAELYLKAEYPYSTAFEQAMASNQDKVVDASAANKIKSNSYAVAEAMSGEIADELEGRPFGVDDIKAVIDQQKKAIKAQFDLERAAAELAEASRSSVALQAARFSGLKSMIGRVSQQLQDLRAAQDEVGRAALVADQRKPIALGPPVTHADDSVKSTAKTQLIAARAEAARTGSALPTGESVKSAFLGTGSPAKFSADFCTDFERFLTENGVGKAITTIADLKSSLNLLKENTSSRATQATLKLAIEKIDSFETTVTLQTGIAEITTLISKKAGSNAIVNMMGSGVSTSPGRMLDLISAFVHSLPEKSSSKKSDVSPRFMDLQFSFTSSEVESTEVSQSSSSQWRHSGCGFFGSGSRTSTSSSAMNASSALDANTEIRITLKAAKVEISRPWLDPGILALTSGMSKTTSAVISRGGFPTKLDGTVDWDAVNRPTGGLNDAIFPAMPVAFLIVKDVDIMFKATSSSTSAVHSLVESRSAGGGGLFCFSSSASASSRNESQSMQSRTQGQDIHIRMAAPQIMGWFLALTPQDRAARLSVTSNTDANADSISMTDYVQRLRLFADAD